LREGQDASVDETRVWLQNGGGKGRSGFWVVKVSEVRPIHGFNKTDFVGADL